MDRAGLIEYLLLLLFGTSKGSPFYILFIFVPFVLDASFEYCFLHANGSSEDPFCLRIV